MRPHRLRFTGLLAGLLLLTACSGSGGEESVPPSPSVAQPPSGAPELQVDVLLDGLDHPWDIAQAPDGTLLVDERPGGLTAVRPDGSAQEVAADFDDLFAAGETGLMGLVLSPAFEDDRRFYTCQGVQDGGDGPAIEVVAWTVDEGWTQATRVADPLVGGIPVNQGSGRHGGCRLRFDPSGALLISTGDNAVGTRPQDLTSLAGKVLRADPATGEALPDNPFAGDGDGADDLILTYGHRNPQGLAVRPGTDQVFSVEHGSSVNDEVNLLEPGGNYGWNPVGDGEYDESVPMTDTSIPGAIESVWSSGDPNIAISGGTFLAGEEWGVYDGLMLVGIERDQGIQALRLDDAGALQEAYRLPAFDGTYGRIRTVQLGNDGALYVTTDNGDEADQVLRVTPR